MKNLLARDSSLEKFLYEMKPFCAIFVGTLALVSPNLAIDQFAGAVLILCGVIISYWRIQNRVLK